MKKLITFILFVSFTCTALANSNSDIFATIQEEDQLLRKEINEKTERFGHDSEEVQKLWRKQTVLDTKNQKIVAEFLRTQGWPKPENYPNSNVSHTVWLVIQHAPLAYQEEFFDLALAAYFNGDLHPYSMALLIDRIRVNADKPQIFGSQLQANKNGKGFYFPPIIDKENVNKRRLLVEMDKIEDYAKRNGVIYQ